MTENVVSVVVAGKVLMLVADTFDVPLGRVSETTCPDDVDGWDSLGHSVLLARITRKLELPLTETLAAPFRDLGELIRRLEALLNEANA